MRIPSRLFRIVLLGCWLSCSFFSCTVKDGPVQESEKEEKYVSVNVLTPGSLRNKVGENRMWSITHLKVTGSINLDDLYTLREMAGADTKFQKTNGVLKNLDLEGAKLSFSFPVSAFAYCQRLEMIALPQAVTALPESCFYGCSALKDVRHQGRINSIGKACFYKCSKLTGFEGTEQITELDRFAFAYSGIKQFSFNKKIKTIPYAAFLESGLSGDIDLTGVKVVDTIAFRYAPLNSILIGEGMQEIRTQAFMGRNYTVNPGRTLIQDLKLPKSLKSLGSHAFSYTGIHSLTIQSDLEIPENFESQVDAAMFYHCPKLEKLVVSEGVTILEIPFIGCMKLSIVSLPSTLIRLGHTNPLTMLGGLYPGTFASCSSLTSIQLPDSITMLGDNLFSNTGLTSLSFPKSLLYIGSFCFSGCSNLGDLVLPDHLVEIGQGAFKDCSSIVSVKIPDSLKYIHSSAFSGCSSLEGITLPSALDIMPDTAEHLIGGVPSIESKMFENCSSLRYVDMSSCGHILKIDKAAFSACIRLTQAMLPPHVEVIDAYAFDGCISLTDTNFPSSVSQINDYAFYRCASLSRLVLPTQLRALGEHTFDNCREIRSVEIGSNLQTVGSYCFKECIHLSEVKCSLVQPLPLDNTVFADVNLGNAKLYVPTSSVGLYRSSPVWSGFSAILPL